METKIIYYKPNKRSPLPKKTSKRICHIKQNSSLKKGFGYRERRRDEPCNGRCTHR